MEWEKNMAGVLADVMLWAALAADWRCLVTVALVIEDKWGHNM